MVTHKEKAAGVGKVLESVLFALEEADVGLAEDLGDGVLDADGAAEHGLEEEHACDELLQPWVERKCRVDVGAALGVGDEQHAAAVGCRLLHGPRDDGRVAGAAALGADGRHHEAGAEAGEGGAVRCKVAGVVLGEEAAHQHHSGVRQAWRGLQQLAGPHRLHGRHLLLEAGGEVTAWREVQGIPSGLLAHLCQRTAGEHSGGELLPLQPAHEAPAAAAADRRGGVPGEGEAAALQERLAALGALCPRLEEDVTRQLAV
mmetsp:Transcript_19072/g.73397  ORF Transcript_19072/g.73397 Transcript_19072/m.73397 type:complete len:259 (+) Transcript_19072:351-1127(+)